MASPIREFDREWLIKVTRLMDVEVKTLAAREGTNVSAVVREAVEEYVKRQNRRRRP